MVKHNFKDFPELTNTQMQFYYWDSPHKQITEDFRAKVVRVKDGDTINVKWSERDFIFPVRLAFIDSPELKEVGGLRSQNWLEKQILNKEVEIMIDNQNRVGKWGRIIGDVNFMGQSLSERSLELGYSIPFGSGGEI